MAYPLTNPPNDSFPLRCDNCGHHCGYSDIPDANHAGCPEAGPRSSEHRFFETDFRFYEYEQY